MAPNWKTAIAALLAALLVSALPHSAPAQARLAGLDEAFRAPLTVRLALPEKVPYRAYVLDDPARIVVELATETLEAAPGLRAQAVSGYRAGTLPRGWSRLVLGLTRPLLLDNAGFEAAPGEAALTLRFRAAARDEFVRQAARAPVAEGYLTALDPAPHGAPRRRLIVLDPGHGGIDPGAIRGDAVEKEITLAFARELAAQLRQSPDYEVQLTRREDRFVLLDDRVAHARAADAWLFLSLHLSTVTEGDASGAAVYVSSDIASDPKSAALALLENRADARGGGPERPPDDIALALMTMQRPATRARARMAGEALIGALRQSGGVIRSRPLRGADFRVLRAPDVPSLLIELGFLTNDADRARLTSQEGRAAVAGAIVRAIDAWRAADAEYLALMRE